MFNSIQKKIRQFTNNQIGVVHKKVRSGKVVLVGYPITTASEKGIYVDNVDGVDITYIVHGEGDTLEDAYKVLINNDFINRLDEVGKKTEKMINHKYTYNVGIITKLMGDLENIRGVDKLSGDTMNSIHSKIVKIHNDLTCISDIRVTASMSIDEILILLKRVLDTLANKKDTKKKELIEELNTYKTSVLQQVFKKGCEKYDIQVSYIQTITDRDTGQTINSKIAEIPLIEITDDSGICIDKTMFKLLIDTKGMEILSVADLKHNLQNYKKQILLDNIPSIELNMSNFKLGYLDTYLNNPAIDIEKLIKNNKLHVEITCNIG